MTTQGRQDTSQATPHTITSQAIVIADNLRLGKNIEVAESIIDLADQLAFLSSKISPQQLGPLQPLIIEILQAQERQDWLSMADYLEVELTAFLKQFD